MAARKTTRKTSSKSTTSNTPKSKSTTRSTKTANTAKTPAAKTTTKTKTGASQTTEIKTSHEDIARRAYERWLAEGCPEGRDQDHWFEAVSELTSRRK